MYCGCIWLLQSTLQVLSAVPTYTMRVLKSLFILLWCDKEGHVNSYSATPPALPYQGEVGVRAYVAASTQFHHRIVSFQLSVNDVHVS